MGDSSRIPVHYLPEETRSELPASVDFLAGEPHKIPSNAVKAVEDTVKEVYNTAKHLKFNSDISLPWEKDHDCKLYSTSGEKKDYELNWALDLLGVELDKDGNFTLTSDRYGARSRLNNLGDNEMKGAIRMAAATKALDLLVEKELADKENEFKEGLKKWILGEAPHDEMKKCWWIEPKFRNMLNAPVEYSRNYKDYRLAMKGLITKTPGILYGFVDKEDKVGFKIKVFLDKLRSTIPKTDEECYLYYKYIVLEHKVDSKYLKEMNEPDYFNDEYNYNVRGRRAFASQSDIPLPVPNLVTRTPSISETSTIQYSTPKSAQFSYPTPKRQLRQVVSVATPISRNRIPSENVNVQSPNLNAVLSEIESTPQRNQPKQENKYASEEETRETFGGLAIKPLNLDEEEDIGEGLFLFDAKPPVKKTVKKTKTKTAKEEIQLEPKKTSRGRQINPRDAYTP